jgi:hypothetical protein
VTYRPLILVCIVGLGIALTMLLVTRTLRSTSVPIEPTGEQSAHQDQAQRRQETFRHRRAPEPPHPTPRFVTATATKDAPPERRPVIPAAVQQQVDGHLLASKAVTSAVKACGEQEGAGTGTEIIELELDIVSAGGTGDVKSTKVTYTSPTTTAATTGCVVRALVQAARFPTDFDFTGKIPVGISLEHIRRSNDRQPRDGAH